MAFEDEYELINGIPVLKKYIKQPDPMGMPLPEEQPDWQAQHELPAAPLPVTTSPTVAPVDSQPVADPAPVAPQMAPTPEVVAQPLTLDNLPTVQDLQQMPQAVSAPVVKPEEVKAEARAKDAPTEVGPEEPPEVEQGPLVASAERTAQAVAQAEAQALAANEAYTKEAERLNAERDAERVKQQQRIAQATDEIESASKKYQEQLAKTPTDRKTQNLLTILFSTLATAMSRGKIPNNALQLIQAGAEQQERENLRSNAAAKAEVDRARQLYGDLTAEFDAEEHVFNTRMASHEKNMVNRLRTAAQGAKSVQAQEELVTMADRLELQANARLAEATQKAAEARRKAEQDAAEQRRKDDELRLKQQNLQLDKTKTYHGMNMDKARLQLDKERAAADKGSKDEERRSRAIADEERMLDIAIKQGQLGEKDRERTVILPNNQTAKLIDKSATPELRKQIAATRTMTQLLDELITAESKYGRQWFNTKAGRDMKTKWRGLFWSVKDTKELGAIQGADMDLVETWIGEDPGDTVYEQAPRLREVRKQAVDELNSKLRANWDDRDQPFHAVDFAVRKSSDKANITPEQAESQFRTAVTAAGTVVSAEDRKAGVDSYDAQMKAAGRLPDAYRKFAIAKDEEEAAISRLQEQVKALPSGDPQAAALQDQIAQRKETAQHLGLKEREYETRFREQGGTKRLNAIQGETRKAIKNRRTGRGLADDFLNTYMVKESEPVFAEIQKLKAEGRTVDAVRALYKAQKGKPGADTMLGILQKIETLNKD